MKKNYILWAIALIIVNSGWYVVSQQSAVQEINRPGADFAPSRNAEITSFVGDTVDFEVEHCFESFNGGVYNVSIVVEQDSEILYSWEGDTDDGCITKSLSSDIGEIVILTEVEEGVDATINLYTWPLKSAMLLGMVIFSICTIIVAFGETVIRKMISKKLQTISLEQDEIEVSNDPSNGIWQEPIRPQ